VTVAAARLVTVIVGPVEHGVVQHAGSIAAAVGGRTIRADHSDLVAPIDHADADVVHLHYTDQLFGPDTTSAAAGFAALSRRIDAPIVVTLHDVPLADGTDRSSRRARAYRRVAGTAATAIVASASELRRLRDHGIDGDVAIVPLPVPHRAPIPMRARMRVREVIGARAIGILGFIYPGKGHVDVIDGVGVMDGGDIVVVAIGRASDGHEHLVSELTERARHTGRRLVTTGYLDHDDVATWLTSVDVPIVPAAQPSASASLHAWIGAGRRPLVAASPYACEVASYDDGLVTLYPPGDVPSLATAIDQALGDPASTWRVGPPPRSLTMAAVAAGHRDVYARAARRG
jgi:hypothetical protein